MRTCQSILLLLFIFTCVTVFGQNDSVRKNHYSMNIAAGVISGEVGLYFDHRISDRLGLELSYGHRFYSFNFVQGGGDQAYKYVPQTADVIRVGLKTYIGSNSNTIGKPNKYIVYRLGAWNLHTPKYINIKHGYDNNGRKKGLRVAK